MTGSASYSSGNNTVTGFNEAINGWATRTVTRGSTTGGPAEAKRVSVNANWSGDYRLTDKLNIVDEFRYDNWRIPSMWATAETNLFATPPGAGPDRLVAAHFDGDSRHLCHAFARRRLTMVRFARSTTRVPAPM